MSIIGTFKIEVAGRTITRVTGKNVKELIDTRVRILSSDAVSTVRYFSSIQVIMTWTGTPEKVGDMQLLLKFLQRSLVVYFTAWRMSIDMNFIEKGGP